MAPAGIGDSLEGVHAVAAAVRAGRVTRLTIEKSRLPRPEIAALRLAAEEAGATVEISDDVRPLATTSAPQGVVATARPYPTVGLDEAIAAVTPPAVIVLDHLEDGRNIGAIARSALAAGVTGMVVSGRRSAPLGAAAFKAAAGAFEDMSVAVVTSIAQALDRLRSNNLWLVGLDATAVETLWDCELLDAPVAIVIGSEGSGLSRLVADKVDVAVKIPISGVESLNASVAASLALFEVARRRSH